MIFKIIYKLLLSGIGVFDIYFNQTLIYFIQDKTENFSNILSEHSNYLNFYHLYYTA